MAQLVLEILLDALELSKAVFELVPAPNRADRLISIKVQSSIAAKQIPERAELILDGSPEDIYKIVTQIAWLGLVLRKPTPGQLVYGDFKLEQSSMLQFDLNYRPNQVLPEVQNLCWPPLFREFVMAKGFPTPPRGYEIGLELPFDLMVSLASVVQPVMCDGGFVLRSYSSIIYPSYEATSFLPVGSLQWHALYASPNESSIPLEAVGGHKRWKIRNYEDFEALSTQRTFLGYSREARPRGDPLGPQKGRFLFSGISANLSGGHFVSGGGGASWEYHRSKAAEVRKAAEVSYEGILRNITDRPSVLYDVRDHRGCLVPEICVILYMMQVRVSDWAHNAIIPDLIDKLPFTDGGSIDSGSASVAARQAILKHAQDPELYVSLRKNEKITLSAWITEFWAVIDALRFDLSNDRPADRAGLVGWVFEDVAIQGTRCGQRRETRRFSGNWKKLISETGIVVFHGMGYGEVIKSKDPICSVWRLPPTGEDLLIASIESVIQLEKLASKPFASVSDFKLGMGNECQWPKEDSFTCVPIKGERCFWRVHAIGGSGTLEHISSSVYPRDAVLFGHPKIRDHPNGILQPSQDAILQAVGTAEGRQADADGNDNKPQGINAHLVDNTQQEGKKVDATAYKIDLSHDFRVEQVAILAGAIALLLSLLYVGLKSD
ncbi:hypothetical protein MMC13_005336 [Lambiella insularis]|nr:hypothetical protein [Lambiella insularis]